MFRIVLSLSLYFHVFRFRGVTIYLNKLRILLAKHNEASNTIQPTISLNKTLERFNKSKKEVTIQDLQLEIKTVKNDVRELQEQFSKFLQDESSTSTTPSTSKDPIHQLDESEHEEKFLQVINKIHLQKWHCRVKIVINKELEIETIALIDSGADLNCIQEGLIPTKYYKKTSERLSSTNGSQMQIKYKLPSAHVCQDNVCFKIPFVLVKNMTDKVILGIPFHCLLYPFTTDNNGFTTHT